MDKAAAVNKPARDLLIGAWRIFIKLGRLLGLLLIALCLLPCLRLLGHKRGPATVRWLFGAVLQAMNISICIDGRIPTRPALIAANHCSWLDILVLGHVFDAAFISKSEVAGWPLVGHYARAIGTLFLSRGAHRTHETRQEIQTRFAAGHSVVLFPQGTTAAALIPEHFHARLFGAALDGNYPVLPVALRYSDSCTAPDAHHPQAPWVDTPLPAHFMQILRLSGLRVEVGICPMIDSQGHSRRGLAQASREAICRQFLPVEPT